MQRNFKQIGFSDTTPKPDKPGRLPSCNAPPPGPALRDWHAPALPGRAMDATNSRFHGRQ